MFVLTLTFAARSNHYFIISDLQFSFHLSNIQKYRLLSELVKHLLKLEFKCFLFKLHGEMKLRKESNLLIIQRLVKT